MRTASTDVKALRPYQGGHAYTTCGFQSQGAPGVPAGGSGPVPAVPEQRGRKAAHSDGDRRHHHLAAKVCQQGRARGRAKAGCLEFACRVCYCCAGFSIRSCGPGMASVGRHARTADWPVWRCAWRGGSELGHAGGARRACACHNSPLRLSGASLSGARWQALGMRAPLPLGALLHEPKGRVCMARSGMRCRPVLCLCGWKFIGMSAAHGARV